MRYIVLFEARSSWVSGLLIFGEMNCLMLLRRLLFLMKFLNQTFIWMWRLTCEALLDERVISWWIWLILMDVAGRLAILTSIHDHIFLFNGQIHWLSISKRLLLNLSWVLLLLVQFILADASDILPISIVKVVGIYLISRRLLLRLHSHFRLLLGDFLSWWRRLNVNILRGLVYEEPKTSLKQQSDILLVRRIFWLWKDWILVIFLRLEFFEEFC